MTPRLVILDVLSVAADIALTSPMLARSGEIMGFKSGSMRVATSRLATDGLIESPRRGEWHLAKTGTWINEQSRWTRLEELVKSWQKDWWVASTQLVSRSNRSDWRSHENALWHRGFVEARRDYFVRPANLNLSFPQLLNELGALGMANESLVFHATDLSVMPEKQLWGTSIRNDLFQALAREIEVLISSTPTDGNTEREACRHFLRVGRKAVWALNTDPLLPEEWDGPEDRHYLLSLMPRFIASGKKLWFEQLGVA
ncbi:hypothetical protein GCM10007071_07190 [Marinobacter zhanjiangensis]|uniref:Transcriptional regulator, PaaX family n=2 Tax=Marinobacter zhanjiangensis TaxID=578215 RepID=A0ABQ3ANV8_9GAMM|nr:hypothetical protein GCM10007071_07190 [Marinobacter zhanjiangensis]